MRRYRHGNLMLMAFSEAFPPLFAQPRDASTRGRDAAARSLA